MTKKDIVEVPVKLWDEVSNIVEHTPCGMFGNTTLGDMVNLVISMRMTKNSDENHSEIKE